MSADRFATLALPPSLAGAAGDFVFDRASVRELDRAAVDEFAIPGVTLMENAATALAHVAHAMCDTVGGGALIVCGPGNNGGDGFALARKLSNLDVTTRIAVLCERERYRGDAAINLEIIERMKLPLCFLGSDVDRRLGEEWVRLGARGVVVDAMFGTGLTSAPRSPYDCAIRWINDKRVALADSVAALAVDVPSGLDCDSGTPLDGSSETVVRADVTVTLAGLKRGFLTEHASAYTGRTMAADIGAPRELLERFGRRIGRNPAAS